MYVYLFLKMGVWVTNSSIIKLLLNSNLLFSNFSCASDWRDFSDDKVPESIAPFEKSFSAILYCTLASMRASALSLRMFNWEVAVAYRRIISFFISSNLTSLSSWAVRTFSFWRFTRAVKSKRPSKGMLTPAPCISVLCLCCIGQVRCNCYICISRLVTEHTILVAAP